MRAAAARTKPHAIVYTAIFGGHDTLKEPVPQDESCEFICFTDTRMPSRVGAWRVIYVERDPKLHPRIQAKWFKLLSHKVFPRGRLAWRYAPFSRRRRANLSIWVDGSIQIKGSGFVRDMQAGLGGHNWAMFTHPTRDCIYDEATRSLSMPKYRDLPISQQVESYRSVVPPHGGLYACGVIVRHEPATELIKKVNLLWWKEILKWTYQDQLSLPHVLRKVGECEPQHIPGDLRRNIWFDIIRHNTDQ